MFGMLSDFSALLEIRDSLKRKIYDIKHLDNG